MFAGFQIATNQISEGVAAAKMAAENGASWLDLNCGCPIHGEYARVPAFQLSLEGPAELAGHSRLWPLSMMGQH